MLARVRPSAARLALAGLVGVFLVGAAAFATAAEQVHQMGPFALASDGASQLSSSAYSFDIWTGGVLRIAYRAPRAHCSALKVHLSVDDRAAAVSSPVSAGQQSEVIDFGPLTPGAHVVRVVAEGVPGGCNTGSLKSWSGTVLAWTSGGDLGAAPDESAALGDVVLEMEHVNFARGYSRVGKQVGADGLIRAYETDGKLPSSAPPVSDDGFYGADWLLAKRGPVSRVSGEVDALELRRRFDLARSIATRRASGAPAKQVANDAGTTSYCAYLRDATRGAYRRSCFATSGDSVQNDGSREVAELTKWLSQLPTIATDERVDRLGPFAFLSVDESQWGSPYAVDVRTFGVLRIAYRAPRAHCSAVRLHVSVDDRVVAVSAPIGPGQLSDFINLGPRAPGVHSVSVQPEGMVGGCNTGKLISWGGTLQIWTSGAGAGPELPSFVDPGEIFLEVERINTGDGVGRTGIHIGIDGVVRLYGTTRAQFFPPPAVSDDDLYGRDWLYSKYATVPRIAGHVDATELAHVLGLARSIARLPAPKVTPIDPRRYITTYNQTHSTYSVYLHDSALGGYRRIEFAGRGLIWTEDRSAGAELTAWLDRLAPDAK